MRFSAAVTAAARCRPLFKFYIGHTSLSRTNAIQQIKVEGGRRLTDVKHAH